MNQFPHNRTDNHFPVLASLLQPLIKSNHQGIIANGYQRRHVQSSSKSCIAGLAQPRLPFDGRPRQGLFRGETYERDEFTDTFEPSQIVELGQDGGDGCLPATQGIKYLYNNDNRYQQFPNWATTLGKGCKSNPRDSNTPTRSNCKRSAID